MGPFLIYVGLWDVATWDFPVWSLLSWAAAWQHLAAMGSSWWVQLGMYL